LFGFVSLEMTPFHIEALAPNQQGIHQERYKASPFGMRHHRALLILLCDIAAPLCPSPK